ncbi:hypothetical protein [Sphingopyxis sp.]|uniref:hypothetical protein n=1 Tax=Sphingopyxis sp. TaxID=1908224 RepID=UPI0025E08971|nr:hypothetical protein [Sphingopyxis sp.]MBK6413569.1 hypothetical protein [Sphingopyxis sp.]
MPSYWLKILLATLCAMAIASLPAAAQQPLPLKGGKAWRHKHSGIAVPAILGGAARVQGMAYAADELDVGLSYVVGDAAESMSFYVFRKTNGAVPVWFAQAQWGIENRDTFGHPAIAIAAQAFTPPNQSTASGLKAVYEPRGGAYRSTGVAMLQVGDWYVKLRASSQTRSPAGLSQWMDAALAQIQWPREIAVAPEAVPISDCPAPLSFPIAAKDAPKNGGADMMSGLLSMAAAQSKTTQTPATVAALAAVRWCRDPDLGGNTTIYRQNADSENYLLAVGDNGNGIWVGPDPGAKVIALTEKDKPAELRFAITALTATQNIGFAAQDRLPSPQRVMEIVAANRRVTAVPTWGKNKTISINSDAL